jgi:hypothetical protein
VRRVEGGLGHLLIGQPDLSEGMMRSLGLKGTLPEYIEGELNASITAADLRDPEYLWLRRTARFMRGARVAAVAAQFGARVLLPQVGAPRALAVVEKITLGNPSAVAMAFLVQMGGLNTTITQPNAVSEYTLDDRINVVNAFGYTPTFSVAAFAAVTQIVDTGAFAYDVPANSSLEIYPDWVLTGRRVGNGGTVTDFIGAMVQGSIVNQAFDVGFTWRERGLLASELT